MDGVLVIDKPTGITSHDVVAVARRTLREKRVGHIGTLDPLATGVLGLVCGRATRLAQFLSAADKDYEATIRFGLVTDSYDVTGNVVEQSEKQPSGEMVARAIASLRGEYAQVPPPYSAKQVDGRRAYKLARRDEPVELRPVSVRVARADLLEFTGVSATVAITCSAGFYVRSFAHELGQLVGTGACLTALRRTRSGEFTLYSAQRLEAMSEDGLIPMGRLLTELPAVLVNALGQDYVSHGRELNPGDYVAGLGARDSRLGTRGSGLAARDSMIAPVHWVRVLDGDGSLLALARPGAVPGALHPSVVLI